jgi:molybdopterin-containing oxidoreductase family iron-sulfur binding subunit
MPTRDQDVIPATWLTRRRLFEAAGAAVAMAGAEGCSRGPREAIVPYVDQPPEVTPGVPNFYATTMLLGGYGVGLLVESHEGRPTKIEGNPHHPASLGGLGTIHQASIFGLYDPTRAREILHHGAPAGWREAARVLASAGVGLGEAGASAARRARDPREPRDRPARTHVLLEPTSSPHVIDLVRRLRTRADVTLHFDAPLGRTSAWAGSRLAFGRVLEPRWDLSRADVVVSLDADFLSAVDTPIPWARAWAERRRVSSPDDSMNRLYVVEARLTVTGMSADERLALRSRQIGALAADLAAELLRASEPGVPDDVRRAAAARAARGEPAWRSWIRAVARDLRAHAGASAVLVGDAQPPEVHALAHAMNVHLGNAGRTVTFGPSPIFEAGEASHGLGPLLRAIDAHEVDTLILAGGDPAQTAPADAAFGARLREVPTTLYLGSHANATAGVCAWFVPEAQFLEAWGDARAFDGTPSIAQPLARARGPVRTVAQVLSAMLGSPDATSHDLVREYWTAGPLGGGGVEPTEAAWERALVYGVAPGALLPAVDGRLDWSWAAATLSAAAPREVAEGPLEIVYFADAKVYDGRFAENPWLQELPDPVSKLTWDNAALISPATASRLGVGLSDVVELTVRGRTLRAPVLPVPGTAEGVVAIALGYGKSTPELVSQGGGANAYAVRDSLAPWSDDATARRVDGEWLLALAQEHTRMEDRPIALRRTLADYRADPDFAKRHNEAPVSLYGLLPAGAHQWGMTIDLNACTGCSACVVACTVENNVAVVGKTEVRLGRAMHWLRIDRYFGGEPEAHEALVQPMLCQHCEKAPCEYVCPVNATVHSSDGLNEMIYNRCVGTRFCSNNCPYKVRRFNFFNYHTGQVAAPSLSLNPDVTVRDRGVMEKCTYCVQRIREVEIRARREQRAIRDGEIRTACQQTCPTGAIVFGDLADPHTEASASRRNPRLYAVLQSLGTLPRTRYLARLANPAPEA